MTWLPPIQVQTIYYHVITYIIFTFSSSKEKLPAVDTLLQAQQLKDVTKILPSIGNAPKTLPFDNGTNFKPVQPKVSIVCDVST